MLSLSCAPTLAPCFLRTAATPARPSPWQRLLRSAQRRAQEEEGFDELEVSQRLSESSLYGFMRRFYTERGMEAWGDGSQRRGDTVPFYITSNPFIADAYAKVCVGFAEDWCRASMIRDLSEPLLVVELGTGPGKFSVLFAKALAEHAESSRSRGRLPQGLQVAWEGTGERAEGAVEATYAGECVMVEPRGAGIGALPRVVDDVFDASLRLPCTSLCLWPEALAIPFRALQMLPVLTDFTEVNVEAWERDPDLTHLLSEGLVDFAVLDATSPSPLLHLRRREASFSAARPLANPFIILANYVFDRFAFQRPAVGCGRGFALSWALLGGNRGFLRFHHDVSLDS